MNETQYPYKIIKDGRDYYITDNDDWLDKPGVTLVQGCATLAEAERIIQRYQRGD